MEFETVLEGINTHRDNLKDSWNDPNALSEIALKLSTYNSYLSEHIGLLHKEATDAAGRAFRKHKDDGASDSGANDKARFDSTEERENYETAKYIYQSTDKLINVIQTRVRVLETQMKTEGAV